MCVFPGGGVDPRDFDAEIGWVGPTPAEWAPAARHRRGVRAGAGVRRGARDVRGVRRAARRADRGHRRRRTPPATTGRPTGARLEGRELSFTAFLDAPRPRAAHRPAAAVGRLGHAGVRAAPLRRPVLRRRAAGRPGDPRRVPRVRPRGLAAGAAEAIARVDARRDADAAADVLHVPGDLRLRDPGGGAGRRRGPGPDLGRAAGRARRRRAPTCPSRTGWCGSARTSRPDAR